MKTPSQFFRLVASFAAIAWLTGCDTFKSRSQEKASVYNALSPVTQKRLERGTIHVGDTPDMVYIALGNPDQRHEQTTMAGTETVWSYNTYWQQYEGTEWAGWRRVIVPAKDGRGYVVFHEPVTRDVYTTHVDEIIRVAFVRGKVTSVEQQKR